MEDLEDYLKGSCGKFATAPILYYPDLEIRGRSL